MDSNIVFFWSKISHDLRHQFFDSFLEFTGTGDQ